MNCNYVASINVDFLIVILNLFFFRLFLVSQKPCSTQISNQRHYNRTVWPLSLHKSMQQLAYFWKRTWSTFSSRDSES